MCFWVLHFYWICVLGFSTIYWNVFWGSPWFIEMCFWVLHDLLKCVFEFFMIYWNVFLSSPWYIEMCFWVLHHLLKWGSPWFIEMCFWVLHDLLKRVFELSMIYWNVFWASFWFVEMCFWVLNLRSRNHIRRKLLLSRKLRHFRGSRFSQCFIPSTFLTLFITDDSHENIHRCSAAFISDSFIAWTAYMPHKNIRLGQIASLDHNIWFHAPFKADEWMLYELESPKTG